MEDKEKLHAFPHQTVEETDEGITASYNHGMPLRDYFAAKYMQGIAANEDAIKQFLKMSKDGKGKIAELIAINSYGIADAMLKQRGGAE